MNITVALIHLNGSRLPQYENKTAQRPTSELVKV